MEIEPPVKVSTYTQRSVFSSYKKVNFDAFIGFESLSVLIFNRLPVESDVIWSASKEMRTPNCYLLIFRFAFCFVSSSVLLCSKLKPSNNNNNWMRLSIFGQCFFALDYAWLSRFRRDHELRKLIVVICRCIDIIRFILFVDQLLLRLHVHETHSQKWPLFRIIQANAVRVFFIVLWSHCDGKYQRCASKTKCWFHVICKWNGQAKKKKHSKRQKRAISSKWAKAKSRGEFDHLAIGFVCAHARTSDLVPAPLSSVRVRRETFIREHYYVSNHHQRHLSVISFYHYFRISFRLLCGSVGTDDDLIISNQQIFLRVIRSSHFSVAHFNKWYSFFKRNAENKSSVNWSSRWFRRFSRHAWVVSSCRLLACFSNWFRISQKQLLSRKKWNGGKLVGENNSVWPTQKNCHKIQGGWAQKDAMKSKRNKKLPQQQLIGDTIDWIKSKSILTVNDWINHVNIDKITALFSFADDFFFWSLFLFFSLFSIGNFQNNMQMVTAVGSHAPVLNTRKKKSLILLHSITVDVLFLLSISSRSPSVSLSNQIQFCFTSYFSRFFNRILNDFTRHKKKRTFSLEPIFESKRAEKSRLQFWCLALNCGSKKYAKKAARTEPTNGSAEFERHRENIVHSSAFSRKLISLCRRERLKNEFN